MAKMPFFQFYPSDWIRDTRVLTAAAKGVWIDILAIAWNEPKRGVYERDETNMLRELGIDLVQFEKVMPELQLVASATQRNGIVTIMSRRMMREEKEREMSRNRQNRFRHNAQQTRMFENVTLKKSEVRSQKSELTPPPIAPQRGAASKVREWFEKTWWAYPRERRVGKKAALRSYQRIVKTHDDALWVARALDSYLKTRTVQDGFVKNASTFFANVEDYGDERRDNAGSGSSMASAGAPEGVPGNGIAPSVRAVLDGLGNPMPASNQKDRVLP